MFVFGVGSGERAGCSPPFTPVRTTEPWNVPGPLLIGARWGGEEGRGRREACNWGGVGSLFTRLAEGMLASPSWPFCPPPAPVVLSISAEHGAGWAGRGRPVSSAPHSW